MSGGNGISMTIALLCILSLRELGYIWLVRFSTCSNILAQVLEQHTTRLTSY